MEVPRPVRGLRSTCSFSIQTGYCWPQLHWPLSKSEITDFYTAARRPKEAEGIRKITAPPTISARTRGHPHRGQNLVPLGIRSPAFASSRNSTPLHWSNAARHLLTHLNKALFLDTSQKVLFAFIQYAKITAESRRYGRAQKTSAARMDKSVPPTAPPYFNRPRFLQKSISMTTRNQRAS